MEGIYSSYYSEQDKNHFLDGAVNALARRFMARREEFLTALKNSTSVGRDICLRVLDVYWEKEKDTILACAQDSSKQVRATLALICAGTSGVGARDACLPVLQKGPGAGAGGAGVKELGSGDISGGASEGIGDRKEQGRAGASF